MKTEHYTVVGSSLRSRAEISEVLRYLTKKSTIEEVSAVLRDTDEFEQREKVVPRKESGVDYKKDNQYIRHLNEACLLSQSL